MKVISGIISVLVILAALVFVGLFIYGTQTVPNVVQMPSHTTDVEWEYNGNYFGIHNGVFNWYIYGRSEK